MVGYADDEDAMQAEGEYGEGEDEDAYFGGKGAEMLHSPGKGKGYGGGKGKGHDPTGKGSYGEDTETEPAPPNLEVFVEDAEVQGEPEGGEYYDQGYGGESGSYTNIQASPGGGKGVQPFSPTVTGPEMFSPTSGMGSVGSAAVELDNKIREMHTKVDNVMTEKCKCRTRPCKCKHTAVEGFTRTGDKIGAAKYRNKLPDPDAEVNRLHISFRDLNNTNPQDLGRGKRQTKRRYDEGDKDFLVNDDAVVPKRRAGSGSGQYRVGSLDKEQRRANAEFARRQRLEDLEMEQTIRPRPNERSPHLGASPSPRHGGRFGNSGRSMDRDMESLPAANLSHGYVAPGMVAPSTSPRRGHSGVNHGAQGSLRERSKKDEPLIGEQVIVSDSKHAGAMGIVRDSSHGFYSVQVFGEEFNLNARDVRAQGGDFVINGTVSVVNGELTGQLCLLLSIEGDEVSVALPLGKANLRRTQFQAVKPELNRPSTYSPRSPSGSQSLPHAGERSRGGERPKRARSQMPGAYSHLSDPSDPSSWQTSPGGRTNGRAGFINSPSSSNGINGHGDSSKIRHLISRARSRCAAFRGLLQQGREIGIDSEWSASDSEGTVSDAARVQPKAAAPKVPLTGPVCRENAPKYEGGLECWRRVRVYKESNDSWEMGVIVETSADQSRARVQYTRGGSEWLRLSKSSVLEQREVVWAKMGRRYPWWPAQVLMEIGVRAPNSKANEVTVEWLGEHTVAQVHAASVVPYEAHYEEHRAVLASGKKIFGFQKSLVRVAFEEAQKRLKDCGQNETLQANNKAAQQKARSVAAQQTQHRRSSITDSDFDLGLLLDQPLSGEFLGLGEEVPLQSAPGTDNALAAMAFALGSGI